MTIEIHTKETFVFNPVERKVKTSNSAITERPRDARVTSIRKIAKWNFSATLLGGLEET